MRTGLVIILILLSCFLKAQNSVSLSSDSLIRRAKLIYQNDPVQGFNYSKQAIEKARQEGSELNSGMAYEMLAISFDYLGQLDSALLYFDHSIELLKNQKNKIFIARVYTSKANSLFLLNKNKEALMYYTKSYEIFKALKSQKDETSSLMGIGNVYSNMKSYDLSLKYYDQALAFYVETKDSAFISYVLTNISEVYAAMKVFDKELEYQRRSLSIKEKLGDDYGLVYSYTNMAGLMSRENKKDSALYFADKAIATSVKINNQEFLASSFQALADVHYHFNQYKEAVRYYQQALDMARKLKNSKTESSVLKLLADAQIKSGDHLGGSQSLLQFIAINDSVNSVEMQRSFNELQTQYETDKKEKEISLLNERDKKRQVVIYSIIALSLLLGLLSFVLFNRFRLKKRTANELEIRNTEISKQKDIIEEKQKEITDSIHYAKRIQNTLLAHKEFVNRFIPENFILFKPKDIVSGDFYWATEYQDKFYLAVCDSTGHGVPGAFMSLLNIGFLSEAIKEKNITRPNEIFDYVRQRLIDSIGNEGQKDGMDAILICIDLAPKENQPTRTIQYAAANNEPILVNGNQLIELTKDKMPVGHGERKENFILHTIHYTPGDVLYLYTDGFADQFGGPKGKKFKYKSLNNYLLSVSKMSMEEQHSKLNHLFDEWKGNLEQVDDVCIIGIKL
ncbi:MAG: protein serine/threonine phosphatase [Bacteroidetes bacterium]|jgi:serine phosphatase RsbU (regulator of sigma subunit)|nr:protein serine/threonine phosphatase [Bacteroidota bacterium]MDF2451755.1 protein serine/threonine phosphatase [Bacteroidota bacterium]